MKPSSISTPTNYQSVTVDVPEDRIAEFHAFFARFLAGRPGRGHRGRYGGHHRAPHGRRCAERRGSTKGTEAAEGSAGIAEV